MKSIPLLALWLAACDPFGHAAAPLLGDPCATRPEAALDWSEIDTGPFTLRLPAGYQRIPVQGTDSYVGRWSAAERNFVSFDWGSYSSTLIEARELDGYAECYLEIDGRPAKLISGYDARGAWAGHGEKYVVAVSWRNVRPDTHLSLTATSDRREDYAVLLGIVRSVRFAPAPE